MLLLVRFLLALLYAATTTGFAWAIDFDAQVRPILSEHCFQCHGPDEATRSAGLRLDTQQDAFADLGGYAAIVPNSVKQSEAMRRILADDPSERMPPPESKLELSSSEIETLRTWIESGAEWSEHWSFTPPQAPVLPQDSSGWSRNAIDLFVRTRAVAAGLDPQPEASRERLIRRVTLDLTGLPPTPSEVDAFLSDNSPEAYEQVVDRLLASPHYGERMGWNWLDAARYADTDGFQGDPTRSMWPWRDWLVDAFNRNMPFDQFTIEMLAGDLLPQAVPEQVLATGFNRNHMFNGEGGRIAEETRIENVFDRTETTSTIWLGLTMTCCRCHDHKYDPISQEEYYQLFAFFNNTSETGRSGRGKTPPVLDYLPPGKRELRAGLIAELQTVEAQLSQPLPKLDAKQVEWEAHVKAQLDVKSTSFAMGPWWQLGPIEGAGQAAFDEDFGPERTIDLSQSVGVHAWRKRPELTDGEVQPLQNTVGANYLYREIETPIRRKLRLSLGSDDAIKVFVNGQQVLANYTQRAAEADQETLDIDLRPGVNELLIKIVNTGGIGGFYFKQIGDSVLGLSTEQLRALEIPSEQRSSEQQATLREYYRSRHWSEWEQHAERRKRLQSQIKALADQAVTVMVMDTLPQKKERETFVLDRGTYDKPTEVSVEPGTPAVLPALPDDQPKNRLTLAKWLMDPQHPLTARVTVNRYWQSFFGRGLVKSTEDLGSQGNRPTHPQLLDYLALQFIASGWDVKQLHRLMVTSATYRQSAHCRPQALEVDPENTWWARAPRYRLPSWMLRDQALAISGLLNSELRGPPVRPYQPEDIWAEATFGKIRYQPDSGERLYRRSLYVFWRRIVGPTMFFDSAKRQTCEVKPVRTNTPLHALTTLNETAFVEAARVMADRVTSKYDDTTARLEFAFRLATARLPSEDELDILQGRLHALQHDFAKHPAKAQELLSVGQSNPTGSLPAAEHAAYTVICSLLLNLDETLTKS